MRKLEEAVKEALEASDMSDEEIAESLSVNRSTVWRWRTGKSVPNGFAILSLCQLLGIETLTGEKKE